MTTAEQVLNVARSQIGIVEDDNGCQKYGQFYGMNCVAWCAEFIWWIFNQAGAGDLICKSAYTPTFYQWFVNRGQAGQQPRPGAVVFFGWQDGGDSIDHVGIVEAVPGDGSIVTIEGNTNSPGMVARQRRTPGWVQGYGYPAYSNAQPPAQPNPKEDVMFLSIGGSYPNIRRGLLSGGLFRECDGPGEIRTSQDTIVSQHAPNMYVTQATWDFWVAATKKQLGS
jgi:hypothetical protein